MRQGATFALVPLLWLAALGGPSLAGEESGPWTLPEESRGSRVAPLLLLSRPEIRDDLKIPPDQVAEIDKAISDLSYKASTLKGKTGPAAVEARRAIDEGEIAWIEKHLTPDQIARLWQVDLLWEGPASMATRPSVADALSLSDEQKAALQVALRERNALRDKTKDVAAANHQFGVDARRVLSDGQKQRWADMVGKPIARKVTPSTPTATATASAPPARVAR
jgi:hypothetical protein